jgi:hypothetical protein
MYLDERNQKELEYLLRNREVTLMKLSVLDEVEQKNENLQIDMVYKFKNATIGDRFDLTNDNEMKNLIKDCYLKKLEEINNRIKELL